MPRGIRSHTFGAPVITDEHGLPRAIMWTTTRAAPPGRGSNTATRRFTTTGLRLGELLALVWADIDLDAGFVSVRKTLDQNLQRQQPKTPSANPSPRPGGELSFFGVGEGGPPDASERVDDYVGKAVRKGLRQG